MTSLKDIPLCIRIKNIRNILNNPDHHLPPGLQEDLMLILQSLEEDDYKINKNNEKSSEAPFTDEELEAGRNVIKGAFSPEVSTLFKNGGVR